MTHVPSDDQDRPRLQLRTHEPPRDGNDRLLEVAIFTEIDTTAGQYPISRFRWRQMILDVEN